MCLKTRLVDIFFFQINFNKSLVKLIQLKLMFNKTIKFFNFFFNFKKFFYTPISLCMLSYYSFLYNFFFYMSSFFKFNYVKNFFIFFKNIYFEINSKVTNKIIFQKYKKYFTNNFSLHFLIFKIFYLI